MKAKLLSLIIIGFLALSLADAVFAQVPPESFKTGINYSSSGNRYAEGDLVFDQDFALFEENDVTYIMVQAKWTAWEDDSVSTATNHVYRQSTLENFQILLDKANEHNLKVIIDFWFHCHSFSTYWRPSYTGSEPRNIWLEPELTQAWLDFVGYVVDNLDGYPAVYGYTAMNEPFYDYASDRPLIEEFIKQTVGTIRSHQKIGVSNQKPVTVRFTDSYNPWTGRFSFELLQYLDWIGITEYLTPDASSDQQIWDSIEASVDWCNDNGKEFWIFEFGLDTSDDEAQRQFYEDTIEEFYQRGITTCVAWQWQSINPTSVTHSVNYGVASPRPAFYELSYVAVPPPSESDNQILMFALLGGIGLLAIVYGKVKK